MAHSPPLLFNLNVDPSELYPLDPTEYADVLQEIEKVITPVLKFIHHIKSTTFVFVMEYSTALIDKATFAQCN